jgi:hypothetical protein
MMTEAPPPTPPHKGEGSTCPEICSQPSFAMAGWDEANVLHGSLSATLPLVGEGGSAKALPGEGVPPSRSIRNA